MSIKHAVSKHSPDYLLWNFALVSAMFGINHGCVNVAINYATTEFASLGNISTSLVYIGYVVCAMTFATGFAQILGPKHTLVLGTVLYSFYIFSYSMALVTFSTRTTIIVVGSTLGGFAASFTWVGQGTYLVHTSEHYVSRGVTSAEATNALLGGIFVAIYIGLEVLIMGTVSLLLSYSHSIFSVVFYLSIASFCASCVLFFFVLDLPSLAPLAGPTTMKDDLFQAVRLLRSNRKLQLLYPFCITFGFIDALVITFLNEIVGSSPELGASSLGYINTIPPTIATLVSLPLAYISTKFGNMSTLIFGALNFLTIGLIVALSPQESLVGWGWYISVIYAIEGLGRGVYEGCCRAVFCDFFPINSEAAFSNLIMASGTATGIASFMFTKGLLTDRIIGWTCVCLSSIAVFSLFAAFRIHKIERKRNLDETSPLRISP